MPSYKNQLTQQILKKSFEKQPLTRGLQFIQLQTLYNALCKMQSENYKQMDKFNLQRKFDRQIYEQLLQESNVLKRGDKIMIQKQSFIINIMRAQISLNQKLKLTHLHAQNYQKQLKAIKIKGVSANRFDKSHEEVQRLEKELQQIKRQKVQIQGYLFDLRVTFINANQLNLLTKKLQTSKSNPYFKTLQQQKQDHQQKHQSLKSSQVHSIGNKKNHKLQSSRTIIQQTPTNKTMSLIFMISLSILFWQSLIIVIHKYQYLNMVVICLLISIFIRKIYSKLVLKFLLIAVIWSLIVDVIYFITHFKDILQMYHWSFLQLQFQYDLQMASRINMFIQIGVLLITIGKINIMICLIIENCKTYSNQLRHTLIKCCCCFSFKLQIVQGYSTNDVFHNALIQAIS